MSGRFLFVSTRMCQLRETNNVPRSTNKPTAAIFHVGLCFINSLGTAGQPMWPGDRWTYATLHHLFSRFQNLAIQVQDATVTLRPYLFYDLSCFLPLVIAVPRNFHTPGESFGKLLGIDEELNEPSQFIDGFYALCNGISIPAIP